MASARLFFALYPPRSYRQRLQPLLAEMAEAYPQVRWIPEAAIHLTLLFLGQQELSALEPVHQELRAWCAQMPALTMGVRRLSAFPSRGSPRNLALLGERDPHLLELFRFVSALLRNRQIRPQGSARAFLPHVTLAKLPRGTRVRALPALQHPTLRSMRFSSLALMRSTLASSGVRHTPVRVYPFKER